MSYLHFIFSAISIGFANTVIEWFFIGFLFHKYQGLTPQTWRPEQYSSYTYSTLLSFLFGALFTLFYVTVGVKFVAKGSIWSNCELGLICFASFTLISELGNSIYINYDRMFLAGKLLAFCVNFMLAAVIASLFYWK
jgi:hypothetical protein